MDTVYALHDFVAENADELSFGAGEAIFVLERDDQYSDGWYSGRNRLGEVGLFPQSYTSDTPPVETPNQSTENLITPSSPPPDVPGVPIINNSSSRSLASKRSSLSRRRANSDPETFEVEELEQNSVANPRAVLAAKAAANAEKEAKEARQLAEDRRRIDEEAYEKNRRTSTMPIAGLQLSDESEEDESKEVLERAGNYRASILNGHGSSYSNGTSTNGITPIWSPQLNKDKDTYLSASVAASSTADDAEFLSTYSPSPTISSSGQLSNLHLAALDPFPAHPSSGDETANERNEGKSKSSFNVVPTLGVVGAGIVGTIAATATYLGSKEDTNTPTASTPTGTHFPSEVKSVLADSKVSSPDGITSTPVYSTTTTQNGSNPQSQIFPSHAPRAVTASPSWDNQSRSSSRMGGYAQYGTGSSMTGETSPRRSSFTNGISARVNDGLPQDPRDWGVAEVVEWAKAKGFDTLTLNKFQEHEISGDILIEMDVAMLKEIDLVAFGRRVHIYNAIKELKVRAGLSEGPDAPPFSPISSGYDPDTPSTLSFASPAFSSAPQSPQEFSGDMSSIGGVMGGQFSPKQSAPRHRRTETSGTSETFNTADGTIPEEEDPRLASRKLHIITNTKSTQESLSGSTRSKSDEQGDSTNPSTPIGGIKSGSKKLFAATIGRNRKPAPRVASTYLLDSESGDIVAEGAKIGPTRSTKRSTRIFGSFGGSGSEGAKSPSTNSVKRMTAATPTAREGPSSMLEQQVDAATSEMMVTQTSIVTTGNLLEKIGSPDYAGWMRKKGEKYGTWKQRFFVLKGVHLYYLKSESEQKVKGFINLSGYRVLADADIHVGEFGFKIVHDVDRTHFFSASEQVTVRTWMKEIMKATIGRDYSDAVVSSCNVDTISLVTAQTMNPRPRPPSPASRARVQKQKYAGADPNKLSTKDAAILMEGLDLRMKSSASSPNLDSDKLKNSSSSSSPTIPKAAFSSFLPFKSAESSAQLATPMLSVQDHLLIYINENLPPSETPAQDFSALKSGKIITRLVEKCSGRLSGISDGDFNKFKASDEDGDAYDSEFFDTCFNVFDFLTAAGISTEDISMDDMLSGNIVKLTELVERIQSKFSPTA